MDKAAELIEKFGLFKAAVAKKAIPFCNITLIRDSRMKEMVEGYLNVLYEQNPNAVGEPYLQMIFTIWLKETPVPKEVRLWRNGLREPV